MKRLRVLMMLGCGLITSGCALYSTTVTVLPTAERPQVLPEPDRQSVKEVQRHLQALGYRPGAVDGIAGPRTRGAVRAYQRDEHLTINGRISLRFWRISGPPRPPRQPSPESA